MVKLNTKSRQSFFHLFGVSEMLSGVAVSILTGINLRRKVGVTRRLSEIDYMPVDQHLNLVVHPLKSK